MSKKIYIAGESRIVDAVNIPKDKTGYERFVPEGTVPDEGYAISDVSVTMAALMSQHSISVERYARKSC